METERDRGKRWILEYRDRSRIRSKKNNVWSSQIWANQFLQPSTHNIGNVGDMRIDCKCRNVSSAYLTQDLWEGRIKAQNWMKFFWNKQHQELKTKLLQSNKVWGKIRKWFLSLRRVYIRKFSFLDVLQWRVSVWLENEQSKNNFKY